MINSKTTILEATFLSMQKLCDLIKDNQSFLLKRILSYAKLHNYVKYTSTLEEAWVVSIVGLSTALLNAVLVDAQVPEIDVDHDFIHDPMSSFGVIEAQKHRRRGVSLEIFLGLMKYYRQTYLDLIMESIQDQEERELYLLWVNRFFDRNEISFCSEWTSQTKETVILELQLINRNLTNEKNKYLTIFESMSTPAVLLDAENRCINMNYEAQRLFRGDLQSPGYMYYATLPTQLKVNDVLPWLNNECMDFCQGDELESSIEKEFESSNQEKRKFIIKFHRMLDVSKKFDGTIILFYDITDLKKIEEQLRHMSYHDTLTGLYNRNYIKQEIARIATGSHDPVGIISIDVDGLKLVNDNCGHAAGDTLLITVGQIIKNCFRDSDLIARIGGDEFAILLPMSNTASVQSACRRIKEKVVEHNLENLKMPISISIGWSVANPCSSNVVNEKIKEADSLMYMEKQENRLKYASLFKERFEKYGQALFRA
jgi:diguanylate cyclase (GGDEF)-like protein